MIQKKRKKEKEKKEQIYMGKIYFYDIFSSKACTVSFRGKRNCFVSLG